MKHNLFSIYDSIAEVFNKPFGEINQASATRAFKEALTDNVNAKDYMLYHIGEYNDNSGLITPYDVPKRVADNFQSNPVDEEQKKEA